VNLAERLKYEREQQKMSQILVSKKLEIPRKLLSEWEQGKSVPNLEMLQRISEFYGLTIKDLFKSPPPKTIPAKIRNFFIKLDIGGSFNLISFSLWHPYHYFCASCFIKNELQYL